MKKTIFTFLSFIISLSIVSAQKGIDFSKKYSAGGKLLMSVDSGAKNVYYANVFPNQPNTSFSYLPDVNNLSIQINFRKNINIPSFRYTILEDDKPIVVNQSIDSTKLEDTDAGGDEEIFSSTFLGTFAVKGKVITVLVYSIEKPQDIEKSVFYGNPIPKAEILAFSKRTATEEGVDYSWVKHPKGKTKLTFSEKDDQITIVKDKSAIDYLYYTSIIDKRNDKVIFESTAWQYGGIVDKHEFLPFIDIDRSIFKKSGTYEIIIQPLIKWKTSSKEIQKYITRHTLSITLKEENYTKKDLLVYGLIICAVFGAIAGAILTYVKKKEVKKLMQQFKEKEIAKLQLNSVRSQLNPHFLFNALSGIQNLMNKNEIDNANKYLSKFARLTRNVLDDKELISLAQEGKLLDDYLQMEQLRFGFKYKINQAEDLDLENIEIPSMLLQPFVENAVKHGISQKANDGEIIIVFNKKANDLVLTVSDNGNGFDPMKKYNGLGLQLSDNRIALLNSIYKENRFILEKQSSSEGTTINLTLTDWL
ncbi:sensor histidine kinase [Pedobacter xixiisoli]|uniref:Histidine kinase n=1 Tax=Pedobacter xixiisoli TaxID=1476464 RepID=A0A286AD52_9SPHI|nr:histidine kinase [Pedobacter xixiisoli]SOD19839.1 Histidine kinase [Pedobacter xixiisoli]